MSKAPTLNQLKTSHLRGKGYATKLFEEVVQAAEQDVEALDEKKVDKTDIDTIISSLHAAIFSGEVPAALYSSAGAAMTTDGGMEIYAIKKFKTEGGGA